MISVEKPKIYVVRHGQDKDDCAGLVTGRHKEVGLSLSGIRQSHELARKLENKDIHIIYSSPLKRSLETAEIIAQHLKIPQVFSRWGLGERDMGLLTLKPKVDIPRSSSEILLGQGTAYSVSGPDVECFPSVITRVRKTLHQIQHKHPNENLLIVTHEQIGKMLWAVHKNINWQQALQTPYFEHTNIIKLSE